MNQRTKVLAQGFGSVLYNNASSNDEFWIMQSFEDCVKDDLLASLCETQWKTCRAALFQQT